MQNPFPLTCVYPNDIPLDQLVLQKSELFKIQFSWFSTDATKKMLAYTEAGESHIMLPCERAWVDAFDDDMKAFAVASPMSFKGTIVGLKIHHRADNAGWD